jgi:hypothetical protein
MALADDIRRLTIRCQSALDAGHDYYAHTKAVWEFFQIAVQAGRTITVQNAATGSLVDQQGLVARAQGYTTGYLTSTTFQHFVSIFEDFLFDLLRLWLATYPLSLSDRSLKFGTVLKAGDVSTVALAVIDKELNELKYERVADWFAYLERLVKLGYPTPDEIEALAEMKASRDILVHNKGVVNAVYVSKAGGKARYKDGDALEISEPYHRASWELVKKVIADVSDAALRKA